MDATVQVTVTDNGIGIAAEVLPGLGSQFVVTTPVAEGAGGEDQGVTTASPVRRVQCAA